MSGPIHYDPPVLADRDYGLVIQKATRDALGFGKEVTHERVAHHIVKALTEAGFIILKCDKTCATAKASPLINRLINPNVVPLRPPPPEPHGDLLEMMNDLRNALCLGEIEFAAVATYDQEGNVTCGWTGEFSAPRALAAVSNLRIQFEDAYMQTVRNASGRDGAA